jgi:exosortase A
MSNLLSKLNGNALALVLLPVLVVPLVFYNTTLAMVHVWTVNETFAHGFLVFPLVIWLVWRNRFQLLSIRPDPEPRALLILVALLAVWLVGAAVDVEIVQQFSMISIIIASIWVIAGRRVLFYVLFPLLFLYFAVPFGQALIPPLMDLTANFTVVLIRMVGLPVFQDGLSFSLPSGSWAVVEECSGVRYLIASFLLGSIYAYLNYSSTKKRVIFILLSLLVPVVGNSLRAFGIVMIGHYSGMKLALGVDHLVYGWLFFGVIVFLLFYAGSFWRDPQDSFEITVDQSDRFIEARRSYQPLAFVVITFLLAVSFSVF